jgi:hypothetical protein
VPGPTIILAAAAPTAPTTAPATSPFAACFVPPQTLPQNPKVDTSAFNVAIVVPTLGEFNFAQFGPSEFQYVIELLATLLAI